MNASLQLVSINQYCRLELPADWKFQSDIRPRASNADGTIGLTITSLLRENVADQNLEFKERYTRYFELFDKEYTAASEIMEFTNFRGKLYHTGEALEFHTLAHIQPLGTEYGLVVFVFRSIRTLTPEDFTVIENICLSLSYTVAEIPK